MKNLSTTRGLRTLLRQAKQAAIAFSFTAISLSAYSQQPIPSHFQSYKWSSAGSVVSSARTAAKGGGGNTGYTPTIDVPNAVWLRVYFEPVTLAPGSYVLVKSIADGSTQQLTGEQLTDWGYSTAYFNGSQLDISLVKVPGDEAVLTIKDVEVGDLDMAMTQSQCGSADNRTASNNKKIGRIVPVGCTGWIITNGKIVTAGHCVGSRMQILEFNVPQSSSSGAIVHPAPQDQYVINQNSIQYSTGLGSDWAVFTVNNNATTGKSPLAAQGASFSVERVNSAVTLRITGYGVDVGSANQTQQTHKGDYVSSTSSRFFYTVDTEGGNSGSPIINTATGKSIGVHTNGGCNSATFNFQNSGTNAKVTAFWNAMGLSSGRMAPASDPSLLAQSLKINERTFTFTKTELTPKDAIVRIFDRYGNLVRTANLKDGETQLSVAREGIYIVSIISGESVSAKQYYIK